MNEGTLHKDIGDGVLLVDWQCQRRSMLVESLLNSGIQVTAAEGPQQAAAYRPNLVVMPARWSGNGGAGVGDSIGGLAVLHALRGLPSHPYVIVFRGPDEAVNVTDCCRYLLEGAHCYVDSCEALELRPHILECLEARRNQRSLRHQIKDASLGQLRIIWSSEAMQSVIEQVHKAAMLSDATVLLTGQTGTGKQLLAEAIHHLDEKRRGHPFVTVNCSAISALLAESELFGHRRGAFTGAVADRLGCFRAADHGTLFLDEIGELDLGLQPKLLRVLEEKRVRSLGQDTETAVDVRVILATNRDLQALVAEGRFRLDLYQRLSIIHIKVPPLSHRREDLLPLMNFFINKHRSFYPGEIDAIDPRVIEVLARLDFEGNVRELENLVRLILFQKKQGRRIELEDLPQGVLQRVAASPTAFNEKAISDYLLALVVNNGLSLAEALNQCERTLLATALKYSQGNRSATASLLKVAQRTFFNKIRHHKL